MDGCDEQAREQGAIRVGVAGWDYPDWKAIVYPVGAERRFDRLAWVARFVDVIEVNSTFYRPAAPRTTAAWVRRTRDRTGFTFTAKAHRSWTHESDFDADAVIAPTLAGLGPLREAGRLGAVVIQFPQSFRDGPAARDRLQRLAERLTDWPSCVELRHSSWDTDAVAAWLEERRLGWCLVDQPIAGRATIGPRPRVTAPFGYARLHGRNVADWFRPDAGRDARYDYLYSPEQLRELAGQFTQMAAETRALYVIQNNHFRGQALVNALQLKRLLQGETPRAPEELVATYPQLAAQVVTERRRLF